MNRKYKPGELLELLEERLYLRRRAYSNFKDLSAGGTRKLQTVWTLEFLREKNLLCIGGPEIEPVEPEDLSRKQSEEMAEDIEAKAADPAPGPAGGKSYLDGSMNG